MTITPLLGPNGKIPILIRDDDINFFTKSSMLESIYSYAWKNQFKVSLSVIPYQKDFNDVCIPSNFRNSQEYHSVENNKELCLFLKDKIDHSHVEIIQHGVSHALIDGRGEFSRNIDGNSDKNTIINDTYFHYYDSYDNDDNDNKNNVVGHNYGNNRIDFESYVNVGRNIIKKSLGIAPVFFAPPFDDFSIKNLNLLLDLEMIPIYGQSNYHRFFRSPYVPNYFKRYLTNKIIKKFANAGFIVPFIIHNANNHNNQNKNGITLHIPKRPKMDPISSNIGERSQTFVKWVSNAISYCTTQRSPLCILNHYHHYFYDWNYDSVTRKDLFEQWQQIMHLLIKIPFSWKASFLDLHQRIQKINKINISKTGLKITIGSNDLVEDISFKVDDGLNVEKNGNLVFDDDEDKTIFTVNQLQPDSKTVFYLK
jgi:hypothetical protein